MNEKKRKHIWQSVANAVLLGGHDARLVFELARSLIKSGKQYALQSHLCEDIVTYALAQGVEADAAKFAKKTTAIMYHVLSKYDMVRKGEQGFYEFNDALWGEVLANLNLAKEYEDMQ